MAPAAAGRKLRLRATAVEELARELGLALTYAMGDAAAKNLGADVFVVCDYRRLLPAELLRAAKFGALNSHPSLLPRWRGAAPIERAILAGDAQTGVTIMRLNERLDAGDILAREVVAVGERCAGDLYEILSEVGAELMMAVLDKLENPAANVMAAAAMAELQDERQVVYANRMAAADREIDFGRSVEEVLRCVRAFAPAPGAGFWWGGEQIKVFAAERAARSGVAGECLFADRKEGIVFACGGGGAVRLLRLQRAGKKAMAAEDFLRGMKARGAR